MSNQSGVPDRDGVVDRGVKRLADDAQLHHLLGQVILDGRGAALKDLKFHMGMSLGKGQNFLGQKPAANRGDCADVDGGALFAAEVLNVLNRVIYQCHDGFGRSRRRVPAFVMTRLFFCRSKSRTPSSSSNALSCKLKGGCEIFRFCAARVTLPVSAMARKYSSCFSVIPKTQPSFVLSAGEV